MLRTSGLCIALTMALTCLAGASALAGGDGAWSVSKSSGEVWISTTGAKQASLKQENTLEPGDTIRTGRNGRVLLMRGEETILIAPNSVIGVPAENKNGMSTTIQQQAGSILLEVEKRNVKHFEVETPYLAAVVKGTHFSVTVTGASTHVEVLRGQVEVSDFKSGQIVEVMPGQTATMFTHGRPGLSLSGSGPFNPIEQGKPRASTLQRIPVPRGGLPAPRSAGDGRAIHALAPVGKPLAPASQQAKLEQGSVTHNAIHISTALGEVRLNVQKATHGLAHGSTAPGLSRGASRDSAKDTIWSNNANSNASGTTAYGHSTAANGNAAGAGGTTTGDAAAGVTTVAATAGAASNSNKGNGGNGGNNGNGNGATGNGKGAGNGNGGNGGNNGNGNNGGHGNGGGNGNGNGKH